MASASRLAKERRGSPALDELRRLWQSTWFCYALLIMASVAVYANSFQGVFLFDDVVILEQLQQEPFEWRSVLRPGNMRGLVMASFALNYAWGGLDVRGYHFVNLIIHTCAGLILFDLLRRIFLLPRFVARVPLSGKSLAFAIALLWLVHPLQAQAVTYIVQRFESMMALCFLGFLYCLVRSSRSERALQWQIAAIVVLLLGLRCKEVMITAPLVGLLLDRLVLSDSWRAVWKARRGFYLAILVPAVVAIIAVLPVLLQPDSTVGFGVVRYTPLEYLQTQPGVILHYLRLSLWPKPLCLDYDWPVAQTAMTIVGPTLVLLTLATAAIVSWRRAPPWSFMVLAFFVVLAPTSSVIPFRDIAFEHRMYLPLAVVLTAWVMLVAIAVARTRIDHPGIVCGVLLVAATATLGWLTVERNRVYADPIAMWSDVLATAPHNYRAHNNLANALADTGELAQAIAHAEEALRLCPQSAEIHANVARLLADDGRDLLRARWHAEQAIRLKPDWPEAYGHLGYVAGQQKQWSVALSAYQQLLAARPNSAETHANVARLFAAMGRRDQALAHQREAERLDPTIPALDEDVIRSSEPGIALIEEALAYANNQQPQDAMQTAERALQIAPNSATVLARAGLVWQRCGDAERALACFRDAIRVDPKHAEAWYLLGNFERARNDAVAAQQSYRQAIALNPKLGEAHNNLGTLLAASDPATAATHFEAALQIDPNNCEAYSNLGNAHVRQGRRAEAIRCYQKALQLQPNHPTALRNLKVVMEMN